MPSFRLHRRTCRRRKIYCASLNRLSISKKVSLDELTFELEKRNARLAELEKILDAQKKIVQDLKNKVSEALLGFENNGLTVTNEERKSICLPR
ncbi:MAG: hypothetical protein MZV63_14835 [Marinilabiliales bacterium]|nr:hypothetical protein [Marinilabiliales bacterium]